MALYNKANLDRGVKKNQQNLVKRIYVENNATNIFYRVTKNKENKNH